MVNYRQCATCAGPLTKRWQKRCCSKSCAARQTPIRSQAGADNGNFKNWRSKERTRYQRQFVALNPEKRRAQQIVADAIRRGELVRPDRCASCLRDCKPDAHHPDYAAPLRVEWLCKTCHRAADLIAVRLRRALVQESA